MERISRRLFTALTSGIGIQQLLTGSAVTTGEETRSENGTDGDGDSGLSVSLTTPSVAFESSTVIVTVIIHNPNTETVTDTVTVTGLHGDVFDREVTLTGSEEIRQQVRVSIPSGAAGHTSEITATSSTDTATALLSFSPQITIEITSTTLQDNALTVSYTATNTGSAPGATDVTLTVNDEIVETRNEMFGIADTNTFTTSLSDVNTGENTVTVLTGSDSDSTTVIN